MEAIRILVVEDDPDINQLLCTIMSDAGYQCQPAFSGSEAMLWAERERFDLVLLDLMLPGLTGEEFITRIRRGRTMPIIVLSAKAGLEDKVNVLRLGADDFIPKPFDNLEVLARVEAQLRRVQKFSAPPERRQFVCGDLVLDREEFSVTAGGEPVVLTAREFDLLELLMKNPNRVYSREQLLNLVWGYAYTGEYRTVDVHIRRLREKVEQDPAHPAHLCTKWGVGYYFKEA